MYAYVYVYIFLYIEIDHPPKPLAELGVGKVGCWKLDRPEKELDVENPLDPKGRWMLGNP